MHLCSNVCSHVVTSTTVFPPKSVGQGIQISKKAPKRRPEHHYPSTSKCPQHHTILHILSSPSTIPSFHSLVHSFVPFIRSLVTSFLHSFMFNFLNHISACASKIAFFSITFMVPTTLCIFRHFADSVGWVDSSVRFEPMLQ